MQQLSVHRARDAGSDGNISSAYGIFFQLAAHNHVRAGRRRSLLRRTSNIAPGLKNTAEEGSQKCEDQQGKENIDDKITQHWVGARKHRSPPRNSLTPTTSFSL